MSDDSRALRQAFGQIRCELVRNRIASKDGDVRVPQGCDRIGELLVLDPIRFGARRRTAQVNTNSWTVRRTVYDEQEVGEPLTAELRDIRAASQRLVDHIVRHDLLGFKVLVEGN